MKVLVSIPKQVEVIIEQCETIGSIALKDLLLEYLKFFALLHIGALVALQVPLSSLHNDNNVTISDKTS